MGERFHRGFNARLPDELLDGEIFYSLAEARIVIESWRRHYNTVRPHGSLGYKPPAPEVFIPAIAAGGFATSTRCAARASPEPVCELAFALDQSPGPISDMGPVRYIVVETSPNGVSLAWRPFSGPEADDWVRDRKLA